MTNSRGGMLRHIERGRFRIEHPLAVNAKDGSLLVRVPAGEFEMGSAEGEGNANERPRHRVELSGYWIGGYAVTNAQYLRFVEATGDRAPGNTRDREKGLERECQGPLGLAYPWGEDWDETKCLNDKNKGSDQTGVVYGYAEGVSGWGTYNQSGNVWEWCADWYDENYYASSAKKDPTEPERAPCRVFRGGSWRYMDPGFFRAAYRGWYDPGSRGGGLGLRLVRAAS